MAVERYLDNRFEHAQLSSETGNYRATISPSTGLVGQEYGYRQGLKIDASDEANSAIAEQQHECFKVIHNIINCYCLNALIRPEGSV